MVGDDVFDAVATELEGAERGDPEVGRAPTRSPCGASREAQRRSLLARSRHTLLVIASASRVGSWADTINRSGSLRA
jgi:hypothetical protein